MFGLLIKCIRWPWFGDKLVKRGLAPRKFEAEKVVCVGCENWLGGDSRAADAGNCDGCSEYYMDVAKRYIFRGLRCC